MRYAIAITALILMLAGTLFAPPTPHTIYGYVRNSDSSIPTPACLRFYAFYLPDSDTFWYPDDAPSFTNYDSSSGQWVVVDVQKFNPPAENGDEVFIAFINDCNSETGLTSIVIDMSGGPQSADTLELSVPTGCSEQKSLPEEVALEVYPNPFNSAVMIDLDYGSESAKPSSTSPPGACRVGIYDINGRLVGSLEEPKTDCIWQPDESITSGVYFVRATVGDAGITKRVVYLK